MLKAARVSQYSLVNLKSLRGRTKHWNKAHNGRGPKQAQPSSEEPIPASGHGPDWGSATRCEWW